MHFRLLWINWNKKLEFQHKKRRKFITYISGSRPPQRTRQTPAPSQSGPRVNNEITASKIRLIDGQGEMQGVVSLHEALGLAEQVGLDLVEVSPHAEPPVCKLLDYGKYRYEAQKKLKEARKKQKVIEIKEIKLRPTIDKNDYQIKLRSAVKFIEDGDKVKFSLKLKGREMQHQSIAFELLQRVKNDMADHAKVEFEPKMEERQLIMILVPGK